jgi:hypothetical protein
MKNLYLIQKGEKCDISSRKFFFNKADTMVENPCATFLVSGPTYNKIKKLLKNNLTIL